MVDDGRDAHEILAFGRFELVIFARRPEGFRRLDVVNVAVNPPGK